MKKSVLMLLFLPFLAIAQSDSDSKYFASAKSAVSSHSTKRSVVDLNKAAILNKYTGHYKSELAKELEFDLFLEGDKLFAIKKGESRKVAISMISPTKFEVKGKLFQIQFMEDAEGVQFMMFAKNEITWLQKVN